MWDFSFRRFYHSAKYPELEVLITLSGNREYTPDRAAGSSNPNNFARDYAHDNTPASIV